jgi:hypothetical protein
LACFDSIKRLLAQRAMHFAVDEIVALVSSDLCGGLIKVAIIEIVNDVLRPRGRAISVSLAASRSRGDHPPKNTDRPPRQ